VAGQGVERRLAAVMVIDVVGYSRLVETNESAALKAVKAIKESILEPLLARHRGRIVKSMGDGLIAEFASAVASVACARDIQRMSAHLRDATEHQIALRIGVNLGDVVVEEGDLFGDGVNIAARLEALCPPGGVLISGAVHDHLVGKLDATFTFLGEQRLKNIARPVRTYLLSQEGASPPAAIYSGTGQKPVIAVLPFDNLSTEPGQDYFSDGVSEDIITELSRFRELVVIARHSSFSFRGPIIDVREVGRALGANYVVAGSVRRAGERLRISAELIDATNTAQLWAERYDERLDDIFAIQERIARSIVATVAERIVEDIEAAARRRPPEDARAYDLFLRANRICDSHTLGAQDEAKRLFEHALEIDPQFARACTGLAWVWFFRAVDGSVGVRREQDENYRLALEWAERALELDANDPRVQYSLGYMALIWHQFERAERHLDLARGMNPNDATIQITWGWMKACLGEAAHGLEGAEIAFRLNPRHTVWYNNTLSRIVFHLERFDEVDRLLRHKTTAAPDLHPRDMAWRASALGHLGRADEAWACAAAFVEAIRGRWRGEGGAGPKEYVDWLIEISCLRRPDDAARLRRGLELAGLPA
jgi:adenylate cyclase